MFGCTNDLFHSPHVIKTCCAIRAIAALEWRWLEVQQKLEEATT